MFNSNAVGVLFRSLASLGFEHVVALADASAHGGAAQTLLCECSAGSATSPAAFEKNIPKTKLRADDHDDRHNSSALSSFAAGLRVFLPSSSPTCQHIPLMTLFSALFQQNFSSQDVLQCDVILF